VTELRFGVSGVACRSLANQVPKTKPNARAALPQLTQLAYSHPGILPLPEIVRRLADPHLATNVVHSRSRLNLPQYRHHLLFRMGLLASPGSLQLACRCIRVPRFRIESPTRTTSLGLQSRLAICGKIQQNVILPHLSAVVCLAPSTWKR
jgi:hypothetical protein